MGRNHESTQDAEALNPWRAAVTRKGWTLARTAAEAGYSASYLSMMLREPRLMSERMAIRLSEVLGVEAVGANRGQQP